MIVADDDKTRIVVDSNGMSNGDDNDESLYGVREE